MKKKDNTSKLQDALDDYRVKCKCGHKTVIPVWLDKRICWWCGFWVYRNKKVEFKEKMQQKIKEVNVKN